MRHLDRDRRTGRNGVIQAAIRVMFLSKEMVEQIAVLAPFSEPMTSAESPRRSVDQVAHHREKKNQADQAAMRPSRPALGGVRARPVEPPPPPPPPPHPPPPP